MISGAQILTFPSAFTVATGMAHWKPLLQVIHIFSPSMQIQDFANPDPDPN